MERGAAGHPPHTAATAIDDGHDHVHVHPNLDVTSDDYVLHLCDNVIVSQAWPNQALALSGRGELCILCSPLVLRGVVLRGAGCCGARVNRQLAFIHHRRRRRRWPRYSSGSTAKE